MQAAWDLDLVRQGDQALVSLPGVGEFCRLNQQASGVMWAALCLFPYQSSAGLALCRLSVEKEGRHLVAELQNCRLLELPMRRGRHLVARLGYYRPWDLQVP